MGNDKKKIRILEKQIARLKFKLDEVKLQKDRFEDYLDQVGLLHDCFEVEI